MSHDGEVVRVKRDICEKGRAFQKLVGIGDGARMRNHHIEGRFGEIMARDRSPQYLEEVD